MPSVDRIEELFLSYGYRVRSVEQAEKMLFALVSGGAFSWKDTTVEATLKATATICNLGIYLGVLEAVPEIERYTVLMEICEKNFKHPLARVSIFRANAPDDGAPTYAVIVAETTFFWTEPTREKLDQRVGALLSVAQEVSLELSSHGGLTSSNPFYDEMRITPSPLKRSDIGHPD